MGLCSGEASFGGVFLRAGVRHVWLVDARQRTVEVLRATAAGWLLVAVHHGDVRVRAEPFEAVELDLALLWATIAAGPHGPRASELGLEYDADSIYAP